LLLNWSTVIFDIFTINCGSWGSWFHHPL